MERFIELWQLVEQIRPGSQLDPSLLQAQLQAAVPKFLHLHAYAGPSQQSADQVRSGRVVTKSGLQFHVDPDPDAKRIALLSQDLQLDEIHCAELLLYAHEQWSAGTPEGALGVYCRERFAAAQCLVRLFALQLGSQLAYLSSAPLEGGAAAASPLLRVVQDFNQQLLKAPGQKLFERLIELVQAHWDQSQLLPDAIDEFGISTPRKSWAAEERTLLCTALLYGLVLAPDVLAGRLLKQLVDLLLWSSRRLQAAGAQPSHQEQQQTYLLLFAVLHTLLREDWGSTPLLKELAKYAADPALTGALGADCAPEDRYHAPVLLAWGLLLDATAPHHAASGTPSPQTLLETAGKRGALGCLTDVLTSSSFAVMADSDCKHVMGYIATRLLVQLLTFDKRLNWSVTTRLLANSKEAGQAAPAALRSPSPMGWAPGTPQQQQLALVPLGGGGAGMGASNGQPAVHPDDMASLLLALAAALGVFPELWLEARAPGLQQPISSFMNHASTNQQVHKLAPVCVAFLKILRSLCQGEVGARCIAQQFRQGLGRPELEPFTWTHMFKIVVTEVSRYQFADAQLPQPGQPLLRQQVDAAALQMDIGTEEKLAAYLDLFAAMIQQGSEQEMRSELQHLEPQLAAVLQGTPVALHEPLYRLLCHSVPSTVKANGFRVLQALARFKEAAPVLLERLRATAAINPAAAVMESRGATVGTRIDLVGQLRDREMHQEEYSESIAFLRFANQLLEEVGLPDASKVPEYTQFVVNHIMQNNWSRQYRVPSQKWELVTLALQHCRIMLVQLGSCLPLTPEVVGRAPMGLEVLQDLLRGGMVWSTILHVLRPGYKELEVAQERGEEGPARQAAVLAALQLINAALVMDVAVAEDLTRLSSRDTLHPLDRLLKIQKHLQHLLLYVRYDACPDIQLQAIHLATSLVARTPDLVHLLLPLQMEDELRTGYATALTSALMRLQNVDAAEGNAGADPALGTAKARAEAVLTLLVASIRSTPAPALGHLLLGFNTEVSPEDWDRTTLHPREEFSCLTVVLQQLMHDPELHLLQPTLHSRMLQLLHIIAEDPATAEPVAHLLVGPQAFAGELLPQLAGLLLQALPGDPQVFVGHQENLNGGSPPDDPGILGLVAALRQRAYIMRIFALLMLRCNDEDVVRQLLGMLLTAGTQGSMYAGSRALPPLLQQLLPHLCKVEAPEASLDRIPLQDQITLDGLPIVKALQQQARLEALGLVTQDWADQVVFNFDELQALLWQWLDQYRMAAQQRGPAAEQEGYAAVIRVYEYAQQQNAWLMVSGAQQAAVTAWKQLVEVLCTRNFLLLNAAMSGGGAVLLQEALRLLLNQLKALSARKVPGLVEQLAGSCRVLLGKLQELAAGGLVAGVAADGVSQVQSPAQCLTLLRLLLEVLLGADKERGLRCEMYVLLLQYLLFCRGSKLSTLPPLVLGHLLQGLSPGVQVTQLDARQNELDLGTAAELRRAKGRLVALLARDAQVDPLKGGSAQAVALHLLSTLVTYDSSTDLAAEVWQARLPQALLSSLVRDPEAVLLKMPGPSQSALMVVEAQLTLLLRLAAASGPNGRRSSAKLLLDCAPLRQLAECSALACRPDVLSAASRARREGSFRQRLGRVVAPVLRLVLLVLANAPGSESVRADAEAFVARHLVLFQRLLREVVMPGGGQPEEDELNQAVLAVQLLAQLPGVFKVPTNPAATLSEPLWALWPVFCGLQSSGNAAYGSDGAGQLALQLVDAPAALTETPSGRQAWRKRQQQLLELRVGLARQLSSIMGLGAGAGAVSGQQLLRAVGVGGPVAATDQWGRPSLVLLLDTAKAALNDAQELATSAEKLMGVAHTPDALMGDGMVIEANTMWGTWDSREAAAVGGMSPEDDLMAAAAPEAKQSARLAAASGAATVLSCLTQHLDLVEHCAGVVLLHFVQCTSGDTTGAANSGPSSSGPGLQLSTLMAAGKDLSQLGSPLEVQILADRLRDVCADIDAACSDVRKLVGAATADGLGVASVAAGGEQWVASCESLELLNRQLKLFAAAY